MSPHRELDRLMAEAWPPAEAEKHHGWLVRFANGVTRRANSVLVVGEPPDLGAAIVVAEDFYERRSVDPAFLISEASAPDSIVGALEERGYVASATTWMLHGSTDAVMSMLEEDAAWEVAVSGEPTDEWFDLYWSLAAVGRDVADRPVLRDVLLRPDAPSVFVIIGDHNGPVSVGQVVVQDGWGCIQCLATSPTGRRRGAGSQVVRRLASEAAARGAGGLFAAVMADNPRSLSLFERLSFQRSHRYRYLTR